MIAMKTCFLFLFTLYYACSYETDESPNVGTVLFSASDMKKNSWGASEVSLLKARRYFQNLLPSLNIINSKTRDNFVDTLLKYFSNAYLAIKRQALDPVSDNILTTALSDAIGGYMKAYIIPITKFGFYGGTVTQRDAINMITFYNEIQNYMETDGTGWQNPSDTILKPLLKSIARPRHIYRVGDMDDPCGLIAYYDRTPNGIAVPIPYVTWNNELSTMVVPLKNHSLILLDSPDPSDSLSKYYSTALECLRSHSPEDVLDFDDKMQLWLTDDIVPHLSDDRLYLALNSVLTLVNDTTKLCHKLLGKLKAQNYSSFFHVHLTSKKIIVLTVILMLELISFIPAVLYIICCAKKTKKSKMSSTSFDSTSSEMKPGSGGFYERNTCYKNNATNVARDSTSEMKTQCPSYHMLTTKDRKLGTNKKYSTATSVPSSLVYKTKHCSTEVFSVIDEPHTHSTKSSMRKISSRNICIDEFVTNSSLLDHSSCKCTAVSSKASAESFTTVQELKSSNTFTLENDAVKPIKKNIFFQDQTVKKTSSLQLKPVANNNNFQKIALEKSASLQEKPEKNNRVNNSLSWKHNSATANFFKEISNTPKTNRDQNALEKKHNEQEEPINDNIPNKDADEKCVLSEKPIDDKISDSRARADFCKQLSVDLSCHQILREQSRDTINQKIETQLAKAKLLFKDREEENTSTKFILPKREYKSKNVGFSINAGSCQPYFEIKLHRPGTKITVDVERITRKNSKPSKIPKRSIKDTTSFAKTVQQKPCLVPSSIIKSLIPLPTKRPVDDIFIRTNEKLQTDDRLNVTL